MPETMVRVQFDPVQRRQSLVTRLFELESLIPKLMEEKARIEGMIMLLDEMIPPVVAGPGLVAEESTEDGAKGWCERIVGG